MSPRITVLISVYNCAHTLSAALDSIYAQTYKSFKIILCDDFSTDGTLLVAQEYAKRHSNIVILKNNKNIKLAASLNRCLEYADTEYVARVDGDDISLPHRFEKQIEFLDSFPEYSIVSSSMIHFDENGDWGKGTIQLEPNKNSFKVGTPHPHAPSMIRTSVIKEVDGYTVNNYLQRGQDYYLWYKIYKKGYKGYNFSDPLYKMRDDKNALNRRTFISRYRLSVIKFQVLRGLGFKFPLLYSVFGLLKGVIPNFLMKIIRKKKMAIY